MPDDLNRIQDYAKTLSNPYGVSYDAICKEIMGERQRRNLRKILDFEFKRHDQYNLPEERLTIIEEQIRSRARNLLFLPRVYRKA